MRVKVLSEEIRSVFGAEAYAAICYQLRYGEPVVIGGSGEDALSIQSEKIFESFGEAYAAYLEAEAPKSLHLCCIVEPDRGMCRDESAGMPRIESIEEMFAED